LIFEITTKACSATTEDGDGFLLVKSSSVASILLRSKSISGATMLNVTYFSPSMFMISFSFLSNNIKSGISIICFVSPALYNVVEEIAPVA
jgi:hypothetical protein